MSRKKRIESILKNNFLSYNYKVVDNSKLHAGHNEFDGKNETHFLIIIELNNAKIIKRIDFHRKINKLLEGEFNSGLHALEIKITN